MRRKVLFLAFIFFSLCFAAFAGDIASFVDLGFSEDSLIYMFGQYGVREKTLTPWAEMRIVDTSKNDFVPAGSFFYTHKERIAAGQDGSGALFRLISGYSSKIEKWAIPLTRQGIPLYITLKNSGERGDDNIVFRDFETGSQWRAKLNSYAEGMGNAVRSSFFIQTEVTHADGSSMLWNVGSPEIKRAGIASYAIKKAIFSPDRSTLIFVVEMRTATNNIRYMVETLRIE
jgi:predicted secreted protein